MRASWRERDVYPSSFAFIYFVGRSYVLLDYQGKKIKYRLPSGVWQAVQQPSLILEVHCFLFNLLPRNYFSREGELIVTGVSVMGFCVDSIGFCIFFFLEIKWMSSSLFSTLIVFLGTLSLEMNWYIQDGRSLSRVQKSHQEYLGETPAFSDLFKIFLSLFW